MLIGTELTQSVNHFPEGVTEAKRGGLPPAASQGKTRCVERAESPPSPYSLPSQLKQKILQDRATSERTDLSIEPQTGLMSPSPTQTILQITKGFQSHHPRASLEPPKGSAENVIIHILQSRRVEGSGGAQLLKEEGALTSDCSETCELPSKRSQCFREQEHVGGAWGPRQISLWAMEQGQGGRWFVLHFYIFHRFLQHCSIWARPGKAEQYCGSHEKP